MRGSELLTDVPPSADSVEVERWIAATLGQLESLAVDGIDPAGFDAVDGSELTGMPDDRIVQLANAALLADWACYAASSDRADFRRMHAVLKAFPPGFRVWFCHTPWGRCLPVGYTGWYPISREVFDRAWDRPESIASRGELRPLPELPPAPCLWLFNYSIIAPLRRSAYSRLLLGRYADDLTRIPYRGLAAAVLSAESRRVVARFGMTFRGQLQHEGVSEDVYAVRC